MTVREEDRKVTIELVRKTRQWIDEIVQETGESHDVIAKILDDLEEMLQHADDYGLYYVAMGKIVVSIELVNTEVDYPTIVVAETIMSWTACEEEPFWW